MMRDGSSLSEVIRKATRRVCPRPQPGAEAPHRDRLVAVLRALRPDLSLRQAEALLSPHPPEDSALDALPSPRR